MCGLLVQGKLNWLLLLLFGLSAALKERNSSA